MEIIKLFLKVIKMIIRILLLPLVTVIVILFKFFEKIGMIKIVR